MSHSKKVGGFEKMAAGAIIAMLLLAPTELSAGRRNGAWLRIEKSDGSMVEGELLKISGGTLFLFDKTVQRSVQVKMDEIDRLGKRNQRNVMGGIGAGFLVGIGAGLVLGKLCESREPCENVSVYMGSFVIGIPISMAVGGATRGFRKKYSMKQVEGLSDEERSALLVELNVQARDAQ